MEFDETDMTDEEFEARWEAGEPVTVQVSPWLSGRSSSTNATALHGAVTHSTLPLYGWGWLWLSASC